MQIKDPEDRRMMDSARQASPHDHLGGVLDIHVYTWALNDQ
jgi:hypothetical protein